MADNAILVLGGSGFVGRHVVNALAGLGCRVVVPTRRRSSARYLILLPTVDVVEVDINDVRKLPALIDRASAVINLVGILNETRGVAFAKAHVELARNLIAACKAVGVSRFVQMSALNADPAGPSRYLASKGEAEALVAASGLAWTIFRPSVIFGREDHFLNLFASLQRRFPLVPLACAEAKFQPVYVGDVASSIVRSLRLDDTIGKRYSLCGPKVYALRELVRYAGAITDNERPILALGKGLGRLQASIFEHLPGTLLSRDNLTSMEKDSVCDCEFSPVFGVVPTGLEAIAPSYLSPDAIRSRYDGYRAQGGR